MAMLIEHPLSLPGSAPYTPGIGTPFSIGMTERGRKILHKIFEQDHVLTKIEFEVTSGVFLAATVNKQAVIRVFQSGFPEDARYLTLTGLGVFSTEITLNITYRANNRTVIVDAWAPTSWPGWGGNPTIVNPATTAVGDNINAQPFKGNLQIFGHALVSTQS